MGQIFGISDLPASTIMTPFEPVYKTPNAKLIGEITSPKYFGKNLLQKDIFVSKSNTNVIMKLRKNIMKMLKK